MRTVRWKSTSGVGLEHLNVIMDGERPRAEGIVIGDRDGHPFGLHYAIECAADWTVRRFEARIAGGPSVLLTADGTGSWFSDNGSELLDFKGCIDVDISATPFTNTLPVRRLRLAESESRCISVVYISVPSLAAVTVEQTYTRLSGAPVYRYESALRNFSVDLSMDPDFLVEDYPGLFMRCTE